MNSFKKLLFAGIFTVPFAFSCGNDKVKTDTTAETAEPAKPVVKNVPSFNADSAYNFINRQVSFGPRVPGTKAQKECADWMEQKLIKFCDTVYRQDATVTGGDGKGLPCYNIIGVIHPNATRRILFLTHWDSRPWADNDVKDKDKPIDAADDGGSGTGILMEIAQVIKNDPHLSNNIGIDLLLTDVEDYGRSAWGEQSYCLGTQYWAKHPHKTGYKAMYGVLLDMTGAYNAKFPLESLSAQYASDVQQKVWSAAADAGYGSYFVYIQGAPITDDHIPINKIAGIKTIDIINLVPEQENPFAAHWHTHQDNMSIIDKNTLHAVGQSLLQLIYEEDQNPTN